MIVEKIITDFMDRQIGLKAVFPIIPLMTEITCHELKDKRRRFLKKNATNIGIGRYIENISYRLTDYEDKITKFESARDILP